MRGEGAPVRAGGQSVIDAGQFPSVLKGRIDSGHSPYRGSPAGPQFLAGVGGSPDVLLAVPIGGMIPAGTMEPS
jgi:hypothetical protein